MTFVEILLLAVALGIDCLVVAFAQGCIFQDNKLRNAMLLGLTMGLFQGGMPFIGYIGASVVQGYVEAYSNWIVFAIFLILGLKFIFEAFQVKEEKICCIGLKCLVAMGIATSIDALVAGASFGLTETAIVFPAIVIGITSFLMAILGFWLGGSVKVFPAKYLEIFGGIILIGLGVKALIS